MLNRFQRYGQASEERAARYLKKRGYTIVCRNYRAPCGEIDIIAKEDGTLVFVEVKARNTDTYGGAKVSINRAKMQKITRVAQHYLKETGQINEKARFDVIFVEKEAIDLYKNAFEAISPG